jgi:hypothetical protein
MAQTKVKLISDGVIVQGNLHASHGITTAHIGEGSNLYYTDARVGSYLSTNSFATESYVGTQIANLVDSSPSALNTLNELAAALGDDANFSTTVTNSIALKAPLASPSFTGNVGIGTTTLTNSSGYNTLSISGSSGGQIAFQTSGAGKHFIYSTATDLAFYNGQAGNLIFYTDGSNERMRIDSSGIVSVTNSADAILKVETSSGTSSSRLFLKSPTREWRIGVNDSFNSGSLFVYNTEANTYPFLINTSGNVGIGTTSPDVLLQLRSNINTIPANTDFAMRSGKSFRFLGDGDGNADYGSYIEAPTKGIITIGTRWVGGDEGGLTVNRANVGIGTNSPNASLTVVDNSNGSSTPLVVASGDGSFDVNQEVRINFSQGPGNSFSSSASLGHIGFAYTGGSFKSAFIVKTNTTNASDQSEKMRIDSSGNVSVGTDTPLYLYSEQDIGQIAVNRVPSTGVITDSNRPAAYINLYALNGGSSLTFHTANANNTAPTERMRIESDGDVVLTEGNLTMSGATPFIVLSNTAETECGITMLDSADAGQSAKITYDAGSSNSLKFYNNATNERMRITSGGNTLIGITTEQNAGRLQIESGTSENGGILDIAGGGWYRYYTRVCRNATSNGAAGYWHIKTNIAANSNTMFLAKFYGYIYGSAQIVDLTHAGYAYSGTSSVINQAVKNNGTEPNASSAVYISASGSKVTFRIAFGTGSNFSTYFAGVFMDIAFPSPAGQGIDFEIEAQSFSTSTTVY